MDNFEEDMDELVALKKVDSNYEAVGDTSGREYRYQADFTLQGAMYHVRCDTWREFAASVKNMKTFITPIGQQENYQAPAENSDAKCAVCGAPVKEEKQITWQGKNFWVRNCTRDFKHKSGFWRPANP